MVIPPKLLSYVPALLKMQQWLRLREVQERMKFFANRKRTERYFNVGDWVCLRLHPYRQKSVSFLGTT